MGAANTLPEDHTLAAFADRFLARLFVESVSDGLLEEMLEVGWAVEELPQGNDGVLLDAVDRLAVAARVVDLSAVRPTISKAIRRMRAAGILITDRRAVRSQRLVAAAAVLDGRRVAGPEDLWVLPLVAPTADTQALARDTLSDLIADARSTGLVHSAADFAGGPPARAARLVATGRSLLDQLGVEAPDQDGRLRVEAALREIDAGFAQADLPAELGEVRARLVGVLPG